MFKGCAERFGIGEKIAERNFLRGWPSTTPMAVLSTVQRFRPTRVQITTFLQCLGGFCKLYSLNPNLGLEMDS